MSKQTHTEQGVCLGDGVCTNPRCARHGLDGELERAEQSASPMVFIDARCGCVRCVERTEDTYRMIGYCINCGTEPILILYRAGDKAADMNCPVCGNWRSTRTRRLATPDEIPARCSS